MGKDGQESVPLAVQRTSYSRSCEVRSRCESANMNLLGRAWSSITTAGNS